MEALWASVLKNVSLTLFRRLGIGSVGYSRCLGHTPGSVLTDVGDENPQWTADRLLSFFAEDEGIPSMDLSYLKDNGTLF